MSAISLVQIDESEFAEFMEATLPSYSRARAEADRVSFETAESEARRQQKEILPKGIATPGHHFFRITTADGQNVGSVWLGINPNSSSAYVYDIVVAEDHRRKGYASGAMELVHEFARKAGCARIGLNVFEPNTSAQVLYLKLGYAVGSLYMSKPL